jgi:hypothetical protein
MMGDDLIRVIQIPRRAQRSGVDALFQEWSEFNPPSFPVRLRPFRLRISSPANLKNSQDKRRHLQFYADFMKVADNYDVPPPLVSAVNALKNCVIFDARDVDAVLNFISIQLHAFASSRAKPLAKVPTHRSSPPFLISAPQSRDPEKRSASPPPSPKVEPPHASERRAASPSPDHRRVTPPVRAPQRRPISPARLTPGEKPPGPPLQKHSPSPAVPGASGALSCLIEIVNSFTNGIYRDDEKAKLTTAMQHFLTKAAGDPGSGIVERFRRELGQRELIPFQMIVEFQKSLSAP